LNLLDENIPVEQGDLLRNAGIHCRVIGRDVARLSIGDDDIITLLHRLKQPTFFTRDEDFFKSQWCHAGYSLVWLDAAPAEAAMFIRRFLKHPSFQTKAQRMGAVVRVHHDGLDFWRRNRTAFQCLRWRSS
jgi:predicted nuclease of predicted toxin-antitoxin system